MSAYRSTFTSERRGPCVLVRDLQAEVGGAVAVRDEPANVLEELARRYPNLRNLRVIVEHGVNPSHLFEIEHNGITPMLCRAVGADESERLFEATGRVLVP